MNYTTSDYLEQLQQDKQDLVDNLTEKGITGLTGDETFTELVPEVLNIPSGGGDASEYFEDSNLALGGYTSVGTWISCIKKIEFPLSSTRTNLRQFWEGYLGTNLDLNNWDTSNITTFQTCFGGCSNLKKLDLSNWNTSSSNMLFSMFSNCSNLEEVDLSSATINQQNFNCASMFSNCSNLMKVDIRNMIFSTATFSNNSNMFKGVPNDCLIIVKNQTEKDWLTTKFTNLTNVQTVAEYEGQ